MSPAETGGPAFPVDRQTAHGIAIHEVGTNDEKAYVERVAALSHGMTLLDYFAAEALKSPTINAPGNRFSHEERAAWAYEQSVAMLAERQRRLSNKT